MHQWKRSSRQNTNTQVVERRKIERDVEGWEDLFLAGRMQKPYERVIVESEDGKDCDNGLLLDTLNGNKNKRAALVMLC